MTPFSRTHSTRRFLHDQKNVFPMALRSLRSYLAASIAVATVSGPAASQTLGPLPTPGARPSFQGEVQTLAINALLGGLVGGVARLHHDGNFGAGFTRGLAGGTVVYAGKRVAAERWSGAGFLGREVSAVGASMIANAGEGVPVLSKATLPLGPVLVQVGARTGSESRVRLYVPGVAAMGYAWSTGMRLDARESLSSGAPVFHRPAGLVSGGVHVAGITLYETTPAQWQDGSGRFEEMTAHERVHILQHDFAVQVFGRPIQRRALSRVPGGAKLDRYLELGFQYPIWIGASAAIPYGERPWEKEAYFLSARSRTRPTSADR